MILPLVSRLVVLALLVVVPLGTRARAAEDKLPLWKVEGGTATVWLLGSVHFLKKSDYPLPEPMETAYSEARIVVFETDMKALESPAVQLQLLTKGRLPDGKTLSDVLSSATHTDLMKHAEQTGLPSFMLEPLKPSVAVTMIVAMELVKMGLNPEYGVDQHFFTRCERDGKEVVALETVDFQIDLLTNFSPEEGEALVKTTLNEVETLREVLQELIAAWRKGDTARLDQWLNDAKKDAPAVMKRLLTDRNEQWVGRIEKLARGDKPVLVVVGAAHLVGEKSVVDLLQQRGLKVAQSQDTKP